MPKTLIYGGPHPASPSSFYLNPPTPSGFTPNTHHPKPPSREKQSVLACWERLLLSSNRTIMSRSFSGAKFLSALILDTLSLSRRGYSAASQGAMAARSGAATARMGKAAKEEAGRASESAWVPDPVTGYYRPANRANEIDVAELREMLLKQRIGTQ